MSSVIERVVAWPHTAMRRAGALVVPERWKSGVELPPAPNYLIVGAQKAGTRWLRYNLARHPDVFAARAEVHYFNTRRYSNGADWYRSQFAGWSGERAIGESTPGYTMPRQRPARTAERIDEQLPGVRLFAVLRDPCDRALSAFIHHMNQGRLDPETDLLEHVRAQPPKADILQIVGGGLYAANLAPYRERFGERLLVFLNEDLQGDPRSVYRRALVHLDVDAGFVPDRLDKVRFSNRAPKASRYRSARQGRRPLSADERAALYPYFAADIDRLEQMLGRDLSHWRPPAASNAPGP